MKYCNFLFFVIIFFIPVQDEFVIFRAEETEVEKVKTDYEIKLSFKILDGYYIQAETGVPENIIPTRVSFIKNEFYEIIQSDFFSEGTQTIFLDTIAHTVLSDSFELRVFLKLKKENLKRVKKLRGKIFYQACNNRQCFFPRNLDFEVEFI